MSCECLLCPLITLSVLILPGRIIPGIPEGAQCMDAFCAALVLIGAAKAGGSWDRPCSSLPPEVTKFLLSNSSGINLELGAHLNELHGRDEIQGQL